MSLGGLFGVVTVVICLVPSTAGATDFCVPSFTAACPNNGSNVAQSDLETAMKTNGTDGTPDTVRIAAGTYIDPQTFNTAGSDKLTITGAGPTATVLTSAGSCNCFVALFGGREVEAHDLSVVVPASFPDGQGSAVYLAGGSMDNVTLESKNVGSKGLYASDPGTKFTNGVIKPSGSGTLADGAETNSFTPTTLSIRNTRIVNSNYGLTATADGQISAQGMRIQSRLAGVYAGGGSATIRNSVIESSDNYGLQAQIFNDPENSIVDADHVTLIGPGAPSTDPALSSTNDSGSGHADVSVSNSIATGYASGFSLVAAAGPGFGGAEINVAWSNIDDSGNAPGVEPNYSHTIFANPRLGPAGAPARTSPSVDAADPGSTLATDIIGTTRPQDGDSNGTAVSDQGAYELGNLPPRTSIESGPGGKLAKGIAKFKFSSSEPGSKFKCSLDRKKRRKCASPKTYMKLKPGRHFFKVFAIDGFGAADKTPAKVRFKLPK